MIKETLLWCEKCNSGYTLEWNPFQPRPVSVKTFIYKRIKMNVYKCFSCGYRVALPVGKPCEDHDHNRN